MTRGGSLLNTLPLPAKESGFTVRSVIMLVANAVRCDPRVRKEARTLSSDGNRVVVFGLDKPTNIPSAEEPPEFEIELLSEPVWPVLQWIVKKFGRFWWGLKGVDAEADEPGDDSSLLQEEVPSGFVSVLRSLNAFLRFRAGEKSFRSASDRILHLDPDIVHAHDLNTLRPASEISRQANARLVYDSHEIFSEMGAYHPLYRRWLRAVEASVLTSSSPAIITVSESIADWFSRQYSVPKPVVVPNTPPVVDVVPRYELLEQREPQKSQTVTFLYQGSLSPRRGILPLVRAFLESKGQAVLLIRGPGRLRDHLASLLKESNSEQVQLLPPVSPDELVSAAARDADVGVVPFIPHSLNYKYALPNKLFEYLAAGLAVLSTDLPEIRRLNEQYGFGELYQPGRQWSLLQAVARLAGDRTRLERLQRRARRSHIETLNWEHSSESLVELYGELTDG